MDELSSKMKSMYQLSLKEAARSNVGYRLGCIATYGGKIIGRACNTSKFSKETCTCHAEVNVLDNLYNTYTRKCKRDKIIHIFRKTKLYISRLTRGGDSQNSAPCVQCIHKIRQYHIKKISYYLLHKATLNFENLYRAVGIECANMRCLVAFRLEAPGHTPIPVK
jgi:tRNA(Arg) A34 adenosine deaminase TadA